MKSNPTLSRRFLPGFTPVTSPMEAPIACQAVPLSTQFFLAWASTSSRKMGHGVTQCPHLYDPECGGLQRWVVNALFDDLLTKRRQNINSSSLFSENSPVKLSDRLCLAPAVERVRHCHVDSSTSLSQTVLPLLPRDCTLY